MRPEVKTCPDCGALITPQLAKCRSCGRYLHGTKLEGVIFENLLPESLRGSPGTGLMMLICVLYYVLMVVLAGFQNAFGFTSYSLRALGALSVPDILQGQWWRFVTSMVAHHDLLHIAFNLYALSSAGPLVEEAFDKKKMMVIFLVSGVASMAISYCWYVFVMGDIWFVSAGASGAVCGMVGAALVSARRLGAEQVKKAMIRWAVYLIVWGFVVPGINNSAHLAGFLVGGGLAFLFPLGIVQNVGANRALSVVVLGMLGVVLFSTVLMVMNMKDFGASLDADREPSGIMFFTVRAGTQEDYSSQRLLEQECLDLIEKDPLSDHTVESCELARRANPFDPKLYLPLVQIYEDRNEPERARQLSYALEQMARFADRGPD